MSYRTIIGLITPPAVRSDPRWRSIEDLLLEKIKEHPLDVIRRRPYRGVRGYPDWSTVIENWLKPILFIDTPLNPDMGSPDGVLADAIGVGAIFDAHQGPAYWLDRDFLELLRGGHHSRV